MSEVLDKPSTTKTKKTKPYKRGATLEDGTYVRSSRELQILEPVKDLIPAPTPRPTGRPSKYSEELALRICSYLAKGKTLIQACEDDDTLPDHDTIRIWANDDRQGFHRLYTRACDLGCDAMAEQLFKIADDGSKDWIQKVSTAGTAFLIPDHEHMARSRLRIEVRKWYLSKLRPRKYGEHIDVNVTTTEQSDVGTMLAEVMTPTELDDLKQRLIAYKARHNNNDTAVNSKIDNSAATIALPPAEPSTD